MEEHGIAPLGVALIAACVYYLFARPGWIGSVYVIVGGIVGVLNGIIDFYFTAALQRQSAKIYSKVGIGSSGRRIKANALPG